MIYLLTGENTFEIEERLKELVADFDGDIERVDGEDVQPEQLPDLLSGATLFSSKRLIVIKNAGRNKSLWATFGDWLEKGVENSIILIESRLDKRTKTYKWLEKNAEILVCKELQPHEAIRWVLEEAKQRKIELSRVEAEFLIDYVGIDQWRLDSELAKLALVRESITKEHIRALVEPTPQATSFELLDSAFHKRTQEMSRLFEVVSRQEDAYMFFGLLAGQVYALALVKTRGRERLDEVAKATSVHPYVLKKVSGLADTISQKSLNDIVERLAELDANMKSRATEPWVQVHSFLRSLG